MRLMNERPIAAGKYSSVDMGMTFELCNEGELYMILPRQWWRLWRCP